MVTFVQSISLVCPLFSYHNQGVWQKWPKASAAKQSWDLNPDLIPSQLSLLCHVMLWPSRTKSTQVPLEHTIQPSAAETFLILTSLLSTGVCVGGCSAVKYLPAYMRL